MRKIVLVSVLTLATAATSSVAQSGPQVPAIQLAQSTAAPPSPGDPSVPSGSPIDPSATAPLPPTAAPPPDLAPRYPPPPVNLMSRRNAVLTTRERRAVALADDWTGNAEMPARGDEGAVVFTFGSTLPSVVCAPLHVCDVTLQAGETVNNIDVGDAVRWKLSPAVSGAGAGATTHIIIKPTDAALSTNAIVTTDRRVYVLKLVSRRKDWMPRVMFSYPEDAQAQWAAYKAAREAEREATVMDTGQSVASLDFGYRVSGDKPRWRPLRVYTDGSKTYIQFPAAMESSEAPALVAVGADNKEQVVNYRLVGDRYVADKVLDRAALLSGTGKRQVKVEIRRTGRQ